jgi:hypothetical protein
MTLMMNVVETIASSVEDDEGEKHEFEIIVGHARVIWFFLSSSSTASEVMTTG